MLKAVSRNKDGVPVILFGLSEENVRRMQADQPIRVDTRDMDPRGELNLPPAIICIFAGKDEAAMEAELASAMAVVRSKRN